MAAVFNESEIPAEPVGGNAARQRLLTYARVPGTNISLDRLTLGANAAVKLAVPADSVGWFKMLAGDAVLRHAVVTAIARNLPSRNIAMLVGAVNT